MSVEPELGTGAATSGSGHRRWSTVWKIMRLALALSLVGLIVSRTSLGDLSALWKRASIPWLMAFVVFFVLGCWLVARRYWMLLGREPKFRAILGAVLLQTLVGNLVATAAGAVSYVVALRAEHQVQVSRTIASLVLARLGDLVCLLASLMLTGALLWSRTASLHWLFWLGLSIAFLGGLAVLALLLLRRPLVTGLNRIWLRFAGRPNRRTQRLSAMLNALTELEPREWRRAVVVVLGYSLLITLFSFGSFYCSLRAFAAPVGTLVSVYVVSVTQLLMVVPVHVLGGLGITDITTLYLLSALGPAGISLPPLVIGLRLAFYLANLVLLVILGILGFSARRRRQSFGGARA